MEKVQIKNRIEQQEEKGRELFKAILRARAGENRDYVFHDYKTESGVDLLYSGYTDNTLTDTGVVEVKKRDYNWSHTVSEGTVALEEIKYNSFRNYDCPKYYVNMWPTRKKDEWVTQIWRLGEWVNEIPVTYRLMRKNNYSNEKVWKPCRELPSSKATEYHTKVNDIKYDE